MLHLELKISTYISAFPSNWGALLGSNSHFEDPPGAILPMDPESENSSHSTKHVSIISLEKKDYDFDTVLNGLSESRVKEEWQKSAYCPT